jgi:hypothetical protein
VEYIEGYDPTIMCSFRIFLAKNTQKAASCKVDSLQLWMKPSGTVALVAGTRIVAEAVHKDVFHPVRALRQFALCLSNQQSVAGWLGVPSSRARL